MRMRHTFWLIILLTATGDAQSHTLPPHSLAREMVDAHNGVRARFREDGLEWSDKLAERAQDWANTLLARKQFSHRPNSPYGENLFEITGAPGTATQVVKAWAAEDRDYDYNSNTCRDVCGHYTQIIWRNTRKVGCAVARGGGREVWVCNYDPPGNFIGQRPY
jgi:pathogenesis-related protein 1